MTGIGIISRYVNASLLVNIKHMNRFWIVIILCFIALILISMASYKGYQGETSIEWFYLAIFASVLIGISHSLGEATFLGFCNVFPKYVVGFVSSGTGCAGLTGIGSLFFL